MNVWWSQTMVQAVGWTLLHFLWQGLAITVLLAVGLLPLRRGPAQPRYLAGCAALLLMTLAPLVTFQLVLKQDEPAPVPVMAEMPVVDSAPVESVVPQVSTLPKIVVTATPEARAPKKTAWRMEPLLPWLVAAWLLGVGGLSCRLFAGWLQIRRLRRADAEDLADGWPDKLAELARRLGVNRPLRLLRTACVEVPTVIGWLRPVILLPAACLTGLTTAQLESIIAHELAHIRRHDYLINLLQSAVETLLFYHPAVWWVSRRIREERENCCDDLVVEVCGDRVGYARALATLEELRPASAQLALAAGGAPLLQRIRRVLEKGERSAGRPAWPLAGVLVVLLLALTAAGLRGHRAVAANNGRTVASMESKTANQSSTALNGMMDTESHWSPATKNEIVDGRNQLNQQWFWYRVTDSSNGAVQARIYTTNQAGMTVWLVDSSNVVDQASSGSGSEQVVDTNDYYFATGTLRVDDEWKVEQRSKLSTNNPNPFNRTNLVYTGKGRQVIFDKLSRIRIDKVNYANLPLKDVLDDLAKITKDRDPDGKGINFLFDREAPQGTNVARAIDPNNGLPVGGLQPGEHDVSQARVNVSLNDVRLVDVLDAITKTSDTPVKYSVLDYAIVFSRRPDGPLLEVRTFRVDPNTFIQGLESVTGKTLGGVGGGPIVAGVNSAPDSAAGSAGSAGGLGGGGANGSSIGGVAFVTTSATASNVQAAVRSYFASSGLDLSTNLGKVVIFNERKGTLTIRATPQDLDVIEEGVLKLNTAPPENQDKANSAQTQSKPWTVSGTARGFYDDKTNTSSPGVQHGTNNSAQTKPSNDTDGKNFVAYYGAGGTAAVDSAIRTLKTSSPTNQSAALETRMFHVDRNVFRRGLESARAFKLTPDGGRVVEPETANTNKSAPVEEQLRELFRKAGVGLDNDSQATVVWNENRGTLIVRATAQDLDMMATVIASLNQAPPEVNIKARFVEITHHEDGADFQVDLGGVKIGDTATNNGNGPAPTIGPAVFPTGVVTSHMAAGRPGPFTGILTDPQFRVTLRALDQRDGVDVLTTPEVTTESGRPAQIQSVNIQSIVELNTNTNGWQGTNLTVKQLPFGPTLDVTPYVSADEFSIRMTLIPSVTEFLGYDDPGQFVPTMLVTNGSKVTTVTSVLPLPRFRLRQAVADVTVWDGQTVVIGGFGPVESTEKTTDKVPVLGSIPLVGGFFRSEHVTKTKKELMVFVTATIINPDGTRYHKDEEMPFAKSSFPPQPGTNAPSKK